ncbi:hypothetical protein [Absidia glauca]|uniref:Uncharacterized protein n=1 Tax=Absidia glauca TaxID=4829 RepID=A0A163JG94_ABSGL|nr:hypothetical protein [Absidia glauca]
MSGIVDDAPIDGWMNGWMDGWITTSRPQRKVYDDGWISQLVQHQTHSSKYQHLERNDHSTTTATGWMDGWTDMWMDGCNPIGNSDKVDQHVKIDDSHNRHRITGGTSFDLRISSSSI